VVRVTDSAANTRDWTVDASVAAVVPDAFTSGDWSVASDGSTVTISTLPDDGGSALTDIEYRVNSGSAVSLGETTTGTYSITASDGDDVEIRAVNAVSSFTPADLFAASELGFWYSAADTSTLWTDASRTTQATVDDPLAVIDDKSGNTNPGEQTTLAKRVILRQDAGGRQYFEFDAVDDGIDISLFIAGDRWTLAIAYVPIGEDWIAISELNDNAPWAGVGQSGSSSTALTSVSGTTQNALYFDNSLSSETTRGGQYTLSQAAQTIFLDFTAGTGGGSWVNGLRIGQDNSGGFAIPGDVYDILLVNRELTSAERSDLQSYYEGILP
jgi:hypothetical protein